MFIQSVPDVIETMNLCVADFLDNDKKDMETTSFKTFFSIDEIDCIQAIPLGFTFWNDSWMWRLYKQERHY